ncbi:MAG: hypothetical protein IJD95_04615 [Clostridia bacterium]|nr:hypothetical protein [Clostridia bacterium]
MKKEVASVTCSWLSLAFPWLSPIKDSVESVCSLSDQIVFGKLYDIMINQDSDFDDWLKISEKFDEDSKSYKKMVRQIIYNINAINEVDMLGAYSNLLRAYKNGLICKEDFFRLGFCLTKLLSQDAQFLKDNIHRDRIEENIYCISLASNNLMYNQTRGLDGDSIDEKKEYYCFTDVGKMLDKYALSYGDESKYSYTQADRELANQKLSYSYIETYNGEVTII